LKEIDFENPNQITPEASSNRISALKKPSHTDNKEVGSIGIKFPELMVIMIPLIQVTLFLPIRITRNKIKPHDPTPSDKGPVWRHGQTPNLKLSIR